MDDRLELIEGGDGPGCAAVVAATGEPARPGFVLRAAGRDLGAVRLGEREGADRSVVAFDEDAQAEQSRAVDALGAVDEDAAALGEMCGDEGDIALQEPRADRLEVDRGQVEELDAVASEQGLVVAGLTAYVDDGRDAVIAREGLGLVGREAAADREGVGDPAQVDRARDERLRRARAGARSS